jgi:hypothetical protein
LRSVHPQNVQKIEPEKILKKCEMEAHFLVIILSRLNSSGDRQQYPRIARSRLSPNYECRLLEKDGFTAVSNKPGA